MAADALGTEQSQIGRVVDDLHARFGDRRSRDELREIVDQECARWSAVPIKDFVPIFVERSVRAQLSQEL